MDDFSAEVGARIRFSHRIFCWVCGGCVYDEIFRILHAALRTGALDWLDVSHT